MLLQSAWPCRVGKVVQSFFTQSSLSPGQHCGLPVFHDFVFIIGASANTMKLWWNGSHAGHAYFLSSLRKICPRSKKLLQRSWRQTRCDMQVLFFHQEYTWCWECRPHLILPKYFEGKMRLNICVYEYVFNEMPCICGNAHFCQGHDVPSDIINLISKELQIKSKINYFYFKFIFSCN